MAWLLNSVVKEILKRRSMTGVFVWWILAFEAPSFRTARVGLKVGLH